MMYPFYKQYPEMRPFVGLAYEEAKQHRCALLVIGESHYLPKYSTAHKDAKAWYCGDHSCLNEEERGWINTSEIITEELPAGFPNRAHVIFKSGAQKINEYGPRFSDYRKIFTYIVFYNFFLRPANEGDSLKNTFVPQDTSVAQAYFDFMLRTYTPNGIVFLSRFAFEQCSQKSIDVPVAAAPQPGCRWWNKKSWKYGNRYGREVVQDALINMDWSFCAHSGQVVNELL